MQPKFLFCSPKGEIMTRFFPILGLAAILAFAGCDPKSSSKNTAKSEQNNNQGNASAKNVATPKPPPPPERPAPKASVSRPTFRSGAIAVVKFRAISALPYPNEGDADEDTLTVAAEQIERKLAQLDPPVAYHPTTTEVRNEFVRRDTRTVRPPDANERAELEQYKIDPNRVYVEYDVEVSADQVRDLRTRDRVIDATRLLSILTAVAIVGFLFLRLDEWTGGYLTRWLAIGALALASGAVVGLYLL